jgi:hypothetical protein
MRCNDACSGDDFDDGVPDLSHGDRDCPLNATRLLCSK